MPQEKKLGNQAETDRLAAVNIYTHTVNCKEFSAFEFIPFRTKS